MHLKGSSVATALAVGLSIATFGCQAVAPTEQEFHRLSEIVHKQQHKLEQQERRLAAQDKRLAEQERKLTEQQKLIAEQRAKRVQRRQLGDAQAGIPSLQSQDLKDLGGHLDLDGMGRVGSYRDHGIGQPNRHYIDDGSGLPPAGANGFGLRLSGYNTAQLRGADLAQGVAPELPVPVPPGAVPPVEEQPPAIEPQPPAVRSEPPQELPEAEERPKSETPTDQLLIEAGGILLPPGTLQIEPSIEYSHFSSDRLRVNGLSVFDAVIIGFIRADDLDRDVVTSALTARLGVFKRMQIDARVPVVWREDRETRGVGTEGEVDESTDNFNIGDIEAGVSYQPVIARGIIPDIIVRASATFPTGESPFDIDLEPIGPGGETGLKEPPTGSGFYSAKGTATFVWTSDPVVFFTGGGYTWTFERDQGNNFGEIDPGNIFEFFAGTNIALSDRVSLNVSFVDQISGSTEQEGSKVANSRFNDGRVLLGTSIGLTRSMSLLVSSAIGLTDDSPDFTFQVSLPITFQGLFD
jgi:hypothetical protein